MFEVHLKGHVRTEPESGVTPANWQPLTWPTGEGAPAYDPDKGGNVFDDTLKAIEKIVSSEVRKEKYTIQVGADLTIVEPPMFQVERSVKEGSAKNTKVGDPVAVRNPDGRDLTFSLAGDGADKFSVAPVGGAAQVKVNEAAGLDYEGKSSYDLTLEVTDGKDRENNPDPAIDHQIALKIKLIDINFPTSLSTTVSDPSPATGESVTITVTMNNPPRGLARDNFSIALDRLLGGVVSRIDSATLDRNATNPVATFTVTESEAVTVYYTAQASMWVTEGGGHIEFVTGDQTSVTWGN